jgi:hypothetical protein
MAANTKDEATSQARHTLRRAALLTSGAGIGYGVLAVVGWLMLTDVRRYMVDDANFRVLLAEGDAGSELAALYILPFAAILFLWFIVALRGWIRSTQQRRNLLISDVQLVSGVVFTAVFLVGVGALASVTIVSQSDPGSISPETLRAMTAFGQTLMVVMGVRIAAIFVIATASLGMTTRVLPRWFSYTSYVFGLILMLTPIVSPVLINAFPIWVIVLSAMLLFHLLRLDDEDLPGFAARGTLDGSGGGSGPPDLID